MTLALQQKIAQSHHRTEQAARRFCQPQDVEEMAAQARLRALLKLHQLRKPEFFGTWMTFHVRTVAWNQYRFQKLHPTEPLEAAAFVPDPAETPEECCVRAEGLRRLAWAITRLSVEHRAVIALHHFEGRDVEECARLLGVPVGTVKSRLSRARAVLRRRLEGWG